MKNDGSTSQDIFESYMKAQPRTWVWRHRDKKDMMALNRGKRVGTFANPADFTVGDGRNMRTYWAEVKSTQNETRFDYSQIEPAQRSAASISARIGSPYFFFIHALKLNRWFILSAEQFAADTAAGKKSRRFEELEPCSVM